MDLEPQLNYRLSIRKLKISALVGGTYTKSEFTQRQIGGSNISNDNLLQYISAAPSVTIQENSTANYASKYAGGFSRIGFIWADRYIVNFTGNVDGSSLFGPGHRWGKFGSAGAGWIFSETRLLKDLAPWLSFGKVSADYGLTGGNTNTPYQYQHID